MKRIIIPIATLLVFSFSLLAVSCNQPQSEGKVEETAKEIKEDLQKEKEQLKKDIGEAQTAIDAKIDQLNQQMQEATAQGKQELTQAISDLKAKKEELNQAMTRMGENMEEGWKDFKKNVNQTIESVESEVDEALG